MPSADSSVIESVVSMAAHSVGSKEQLRAEKKDCCWADRRVAERVAQKAHSTAECLAGMSALQTAAWMGARKVAHLAPTMAVKMGCTLAEKKVYW